MHLTTAGRGWGGGVCGRGERGKKSPRLREGSRGDNVRLMQEYLRTISQRYPIPTIVADGIFGAATKNAVTAFQRTFGLTPDGIIGKNTWNRIVAVRLLM